MFSCTYRTLSRRTLQNYKLFSHSIPKRGRNPTDDPPIHAIPDNAPTVSENVEWLESLRKPEESTIAEFEAMDNVPTSTYEIKSKSETDLDPKNPDLMTFKSPKTKKTYTVISRPRRDKDQYYPYFTLSVPVTDYAIASSPFSALPSKRRPKADNSQPFSDLKVVKLRSGAGGSGTVSFFRDAGTAIGPPDGGDGGDGGNIYVTAIPGLSSLHGIRSKYVAQDGSNGQSGQLDGKNGNDVYITVPVGTTISWCADPKEIRSFVKDSSEKVFNILSVGDKDSDLFPKFIQFFRNSYKIGKGWIFKDKNEEYHLERDYFVNLNDKVKIFDRQLKYDELMDDTFPIDGIDFPEPTKDPVLLLKGGRGGMGNMHFSTSEIRNPRFAKEGRTGLEQNFIFELKLLADLGLVGLPNAGKSTLLRAISNARPRVGHWEFTTLQPTIGTISLRIDQPPFTVADIPGVVKGASENRGMGLTFLRHVERSGGIVFVISLGSEKPNEDLQILLDEMGDERLRGKNILIVATKADLEGSQQKYTELKDFVKDRNWKCVPCCAMKKENVERVIGLMAECSGRIDNA